MLNASRIGICTLLLSAAVGANAHELFVRFAPAPADTHARIAVVNNGTFHESAGALGLDRLRDVSLHQNGNRTAPDLAAWEEAGKQSRLTVHPAGSGTLLLGVSTKTSTSTRTAAEFAEYLELEDLPDTLASYDASKYPVGVTYHYAKHARAIGQVGDALTDDYAASLGYPLEIRLHRNPGAIAVGDRVTFQVLHNGAPVSGLRVYAGAGAHAPAAGGHDGATLLRTDADGKAGFDITTLGTWYIHANRMVPSERQGADFVSDRASLTFEIVAR